jgi:hypothetical protein
VCILETLKRNDKGEKEEEKDQQGYIVKQTWNCDTVTS